MTSKDIILKNMHVVGENPIVRVFNYGDLFKLNEEIEYYKHRIGYDKKVTIEIPYLFHPEKKYSHYSNFKLVCKVLDSMDVNFEVFCPTNPEILNALVRNVTILDNTTFLEAVLCDIGGFDKFGGLGDESIELTEKIQILTTDITRLPDITNTVRCNFLPQAEIDVINKRFIGVPLIETIPYTYRQDFGGRDILIIEDSVRDISFLDACAHVIRQNNCGKVFLATSHLEIKDLGDSLNSFDKVYTTNSMGYDYELKQPDKLSVINIFKK